jgi:hypothetical protein
VHLDGYNQLPYLTGQQPNSARREYIYFNDDGDLVAVRYENWKVVFEEQREEGTTQIWAEPFTKLRLPKLFNLRSDPYERADITSNTYWDWVVSDGAGIFIASQPIVGQFLRPSRSIRRASGPRASASIRSWRRCRGVLKACRATDRDRSHTARRKRGR